MSKSITYIEIKAMVHSIFGTELRQHLESIYLYDHTYSVASDTMVDSIKILIVLGNDESTALIALKKAHDLLLRKVKNRCQVNYQIFSKEPMLNSLDIFPIEFLELKLNRDLVLGSDILESLTINQANLRQECEFYLRTHLLKLKEGFVLSSMPNTELIRASFPFILSIFKYLLALLDDASEPSKADVIDRLALKLNFRAAIFKAILKDIRSPECGVHLFDYIAELETITAQVDQLKS